MSAFGLIGNVVRKEHGSTKETRLMPDIWADRDGREWKGDAS
jgi:hypothetical protein